MVLANSFEPVLYSKEKICGKCVSESILGKFAGGLQPRKPPPLDPSLLKESGCSDSPYFESTRAKKCLEVCIHHMTNFVFLPPLYEEFLYCGIGMLKLA